MNAVSLPVTNGLYSVLLGDTSITNMAAIPPSVFSRPDVRLRVWFNGQQLSPDQRLAPNGYFPSGAVFPGNVGIGAASPGFPLTVKANSTSDLVGFQNSADVNIWHVKFTNRNALNFVESGVAEDRLVHAKGGNTGIGTARPCLCK